MSKNEISQAEVERIRAEQKIRSRILEAQANEILKRDQESRKQRGCKQADRVAQEREEFVLDPEPNEEVVAFKKSGDKIWRVEMNVDNSDCSVREQKYTTAYEGLPKYGYDTLYVQYWGQQLWGSQKHIEPRLSVSVRASSEEGAAKIANEYRVRFVTAPDFLEKLEKQRYKPHVVDTVAFRLGLIKDKTIE